MIRAILFNSIHCLVDLHELERRAFNRTLSQNLIRPCLDRATYFQLKRDGKCLATWISTQDGATGICFKTFWSNFDLHLCDLIDVNDLVGRSWTMEAVANRLSSDLKLALVSGGKRQIVLRVLASVFRHEATSCFDQIRTGEGDYLTAPSPELLREVIEACCCKSCETLVIDDCDQRLALARSIGCRASRLPTLKTLNYRNKFNHPRVGRTLSHTVSEINRAAV